MREALDVVWGADPHRVGALVHDTNGGVATFVYDLGTPSSRRISQALPVDAGRTYPGVFFDNLLPDGVQRERLARRLGVSDSSTFAMLRAIGGDCAGALTVLPEGTSRPPAPSAAGERRALTREVASAIRRLGAVPAMIDAGLRLSLAGAQDKLAVCVDGDQLLMPAAGEASTHILKLANDSFRGLCGNEHFMLELAAAAGLQVVRSRPFDLFGRDALLVERFDRRDGLRLHQEDVCQALGLPPSSKYEADGGPSLVDIVRLLDVTTTEPRDVLALVRWQAFNVAAGNDDGHAKNVALLREPHVRLAPAYDLVCTRVWPQVSQSLALGVGGARDAGNLGTAAWRRFAAEASLGARLVIDTAREVTARVHDRAAEVAERAIAAGAAPRAVGRALEAVRRRAARALSVLERPSG